VKQAISKGLTYSKKQSVCRKQRFIATRTKQAEKSVDEENIHGKGG